MSKVLEYLLRLILIVALVSGIYLLLSHLESRRFAPIVKEVVVTDTLIVHDTVTIEKPVTVTRTIRDTISIPVPITNTVVQTDTVYVRLTEENIVWSDSLCRVYAHGINPQIDSVTHFSTTKIITQKPKPKRWGIGLQAGYGASEDGLSPYIGIGVTYSLIRF